MILELHERDAKVLEQILKLRKPPTAKLSSRFAR